MPTWHFFRAHGERCGEREGVGREQREREREKEKALGRETRRESEEEGEKRIALFFSSKATNHIWLGPHPYYLI